MKKQDVYLYINIAFSSCIYVLNYFYQSNNFNFLLKCITSSLFAILAIINLTYFNGTKKKKEDLKYPIFMVFGVIFCFLGDAFINHYFVIGVVLFALGHVFYVGGYYMLYKFRGLDLIIGGSIGLAAGTFVLVCPYLSFDAPILKVACFIYVFILSFMVGKTISNFIKEQNKINSYLITNRHTLSN